MDENEAPQSSPNAVPTQAATPLKSRPRAAVSPQEETAPCPTCGTGMGKAQVRRLPVVNSDKRLVGIVSLGDLARKDDPSTIGQTVTRVSTPGGKHDQTTAH